MDESARIRCAFLVGICSSRANGGKMGRYEHEAFYSLGINSGSAQHEISEYFRQEVDFFNEQIARGVVIPLLPNCNDTKFFLDKMAAKYAGCSMFAIPAQNLSNSSQEGLNYENEKWISTKKKRDVVRKASIQQNGQPSNSKTSRRHQKISNRSVGSVRSKSRSSKTDELHETRRRELQRQLDSGIIKQEESPTTAAV